MKGIRVRIETFGVTCDEEISCEDKVKVLEYADDLALYSPSRFHLQQALYTLASYVGLTIYTKKTEAMKFRRGGRLASNDKLSLAGQSIDFVNNFTYLGITLSTTGTSFSKHVG